MSAKKKQVERRRNGKIVLMVEKVHNFVTFRAYCLYARRMCRAQRVKGPRYLTSD